MSQKESSIINKYLDLGTVVLLKESTQYVMIIGYETDQKKDYYGVLFPEGIIMGYIILSFNHEDIEKVISNGFHTPTSEKYLEKKEGHNTNKNYSLIELIDINKISYKLPIGTVVFLKKEVSSYMIIGYKSKNEKSRDYIGIDYPMGVISYYKNITFNQNDIDSIRFLGYRGDN